MRLFFACFPTKSLAGRLHRQVPQLRPLCGGRPIPVANLHLTLAFLGEVDPARLAALIELAERQTFPPLRLQLDRAGSFGTRAGWLAPGPEAELLAGWVRQLQIELGEAGFHVEHHPFRPHLTLLRRLDRPLPAQAIPPLFWDLARFALVESTLAPRGARYRRLWESRPAAD